MSVLLGLKTRLNKMAGVVNLHQTSYAANVASRGRVRALVRRSSTAQYERALAPSESRPVPARLRPALARCSI